MNRRLCALAAATTIAAPMFAPAQDKPPMRILVGFPPGGSADVVARTLADKLKSALHQTVIVENKPGAAGRVALGEIRRAAPDGQTLILTPSGALVIAPYLFKNVGYDPVKDFAPIARVVTFDFAITAGPSAPAGDLKAVLAWMKANPAKANYATPGAGTVPHFAGLLLGQTAGVDITHIAYKGGAPAVQDLLGGQVPLMIDTPVETIEHHRAGKLRILAVTGEARARTGRRAHSQGGRHQHGRRCVLRPVRSRRIARRAHRASLERGTRHPARAGPAGPLLLARPGARVWQPRRTRRHAGGALQTLGGADQGVGDHSGVTAGITRWRAPPATADAAPCSSRPSVNA